jgi:hypothetical protein
MSKQKEAYFKSLTMPERVTALRENAVTHYKKNVIRDFSEEEIADIKTTLSEQAIRLNDLKIEKKELTSVISGKIKITESEMKGTLKDLKNKYYENEETVYDIDDQETGEMYTFDNQGNLLSTRKLTPKERQTTIRNLNASAS